MGSAYIAHNRSVRESRSNSEAPLDAGFETSVTARGTVPERVFAASLAIASFAAFVAFKFASSGPPGTGSAPCLAQKAMPDRVMSVEPATSHAFRLSGESAKGRVSVPQINPR